MSKNSYGLRIRLVLIAALLASSALGAVGKDAPGNLQTVRTKEGALAGQVDDGVMSFKGVPFAAPPVGNLRWRPAAAHASWSGVRQAVAFGAQCIQPEPFAQVKSSEDCLYLNVWTGATSARERRPVMVWIYGGGFIGGTNALPVYNGAALAKKGVVVVALNYRVGTLGFLSHPGLTRESPRGASGNYALSDLVAGLEWVKRNIAAFGGSPENVTIFGESAGSHMVSYLMASPPARGLFHRAIGQSGTIFSPGGPEFPILRPLAESELAGQDYAASLGAASLAALRALPAERFAQQQGSEGLPAATALPNLDGYFLTADLYTTFSSAHQNDVPLLTGWNSNEGLTFPDMWRPLAQPEVFQGYLEFVAGPDVPAFLDAYPIGTPAQALRSAIRHIGDRSFAFSNWSWAEQQQRTGRAPVFAYYFDRPTDWPGLAAFAPELSAEERGAAHGAENPYVFNNLGRDDMSRRAAGNAADVALANQMSSYWVNFARNGNPNGPGLPTWPEYSGGDQARMMHFGAKASVGGVPALDRIKLLDRAVTRLRQMQAAPADSKPRQQ